MADSKISDLSAASALAGTEAVPVVQSGATVKSTPAAIKSYIEGQANSFSTAQTITPLTDVTALTIRRNTAGSTKIVQWQTEANAPLGGIGNGGVVISGAPSAATGGLTLYNAGSASATTLQASATASAVTYTLPAADGSNGTVLTTNGSGALSWAAAGSPGGTGIVRVTGGVLDTAADVPLQVGFVNRTDTSLAWGSNTFTLGKTGSSYTTWINGHPVVYSGANKTVAVSASTNLQFVYLATDGTLTTSTVAWDIAGPEAPVATVFVNASGEYFITDERHTHLRNGPAHKSQHSAVGAFWRSGLSCTFGATNGSISCLTGVFCDEDIEHTFSGTTTTARLVYRSSNVWRIDNAASDIRKIVSTAIQYDNAGSLDTVSAGSYVNYWVFAVGSATPELHVLVGQAAYTTLGAAQASTIDSLTLPPWISAESRLLYKVIYQRTAATAGGAYQAAVDMRKIPIAGGVSLSNAFLPLSGGTLTGDLTMSGAGVSMSGNISAPAWTTSGLRFKSVAGTLTDTSSSGTVATQVTNRLGGNTIAASSTTTYTDYGTLYLDVATAGTNVTITNNYSLITTGAIKAGGALTATNLANGRSLRQFTPLDNQPPASAFATLDTRNSVATLDFDDTTPESAVFVGVTPEAMTATGGIKARIFWAATTATTGNCVWGVSFEKYGTDIDSDSFDTETTATAACSGTSGIVVVTEITATTIDSLVAGDQYRVKVRRVADDGTNDTMSGDAELIAVELRQVA